MRTQCLHKNIHKREKAQRERETERQQTDRDRKRERDREGEIGKGRIKKIERNSPTG